MYCVTQLIPERKEHQKRTAPRRSRMHRCWYGITRQYRQAKKYAGVTF